MNINTIESFNEFLIQIETASYNDDLFIPHDLDHDVTGTSPNDKSRSHTPKPCQCNTSTGRTHNECQRHGSLTRSLSNNTIRGNTESGRRRRRRSRPSISRSNLPVQFYHTPEVELDVSTLHILPIYDINLISDETIGRDSHHSNSRINPKSVNHLRHTKDEVILPPSFPDYSTATSTKCYTVDFEDEVEDEDEDEDEDEEEDEEEEEEDVDSESLNAIVPGLFPKMDVNDNDKFMNLSTLPLTPTHVSR